MTERCIRVVGPSGNVYLVRVDGTVSDEERAAIGEMLDYLANTYGFEQGPDPEEESTDEHP